MPDAHHHPVLRPGGDYERRRQRGALEGERVVPRRLDRRRQAGEGAAAGVVDRPCLAVDRGHAHDACAVRDTNGLVAEADPEGRHRWTELPDELDADACPLGARRPGRDDDGRRVQRADLIDRDLVVAGHGHLGAGSG